MSDRKKIMWTSIDISGIQQSPKGEAKQVMVEVSMSLVSCADLSEFEDENGVFNQSKFSDYVLSVLMESL